MEWTCPRVRLPTYDVNEAVEVGGGGARSRDEHGRQFAPFSGFDVESLNDVAAVAVFEDSAATHVNMAYAWKNTWETMW